MTSEEPAGTPNVGPVLRGHDSQLTFQVPAAGFTGREPDPAKSSDRQRARVQAWRTEIAGHVFISYVREDANRVDKLQRTLEEAGIRVWRDTADLWPGEDWRVKIRRAITDNALVFIACFSHNSLARSRTYQNEEIVLAIEQLRLRPPDDPWLIPVRFDECEIPDRDIGGGRTLTSIQRADLFGDNADHGTARLIEAVLRILGRSTTSANARAMAREAYSTVDVDQDDDATHGLSGSGTGPFGPYSGETLGPARSVVNFDPLLAASRNRPSAVAITGEPGTGKITLLLLLIRQSALRGMTVVVVDPNGETKSLVDGLQADGHKARMLDMSVPGVLDPFSFGEDEAEKRALAFEALRLMLPRMSEERESALLSALGAMADRERPSLGKVVRHLQQVSDPVSNKLGAVLYSTAMMRSARMCFAPEGGTQIDAAGWTTVFAWDGLALPDATLKRDDYSYEHRLSVALHYLASQKACKLLTRMPGELPKVIFLNEAWAVTATPEGAKLVPEVSQVGRSRNAALILVSHNAGGLLSEQVTNCISGVFAFRSSNQVEMAKVLALLGVHAPGRHQIALRRLGNEECIYRDLDYEIGIMSIDQPADEMRQWLGTNSSTSS